MGSILIPARVLVSCWPDTPLHYLSPCFRSCHCLTGNCLLLACVYLNPAHPLEDGSDPTSHRRPAFHFLPWTLALPTCPHSSGIWPMLSSSPRSDLLTPHRAQDYQGQSLESTRPCMLWAKRHSKQGHDKYSLTGLLHLCLYPVSG